MGLAIDYIFPFGIHRGELIDDVPRGYLEHLLEQDWLDRWLGLEEAIEDQLAMRDRSHVTF